jgi:hypothetical protein
MTEDILVGNTTFRVFGLFNDGEGEVPLSGGGAVAPIPASFEIETIHMLVQTERGDVPLDITKLLDDVNSITWRKESNNDLFEYFSDKMLDKCKNEV